MRNATATFSVHSMQIHISVGIQYATRPTADLNIETNFFLTKKTAAFEVHRFKHKPDQNSITKVHFICTFKNTRNIRDLHF